jgi:hypothetical protein
VATKVATRRDREEFQRPGVAIRVVRAIQRGYYAVSDRLLASKDAETLFVEINTSEGAGGEKRP